MVEGSLGVKLPTIWADEKQRWEESEQRRRKKIKLDDGWPESVEEQGLLLFVLRHYITSHYIKDVL